uniref:UPAR/Ly6 domain-containing protein n=1 Tax=Strigamia maritima TaxID=126957 RepID=T1JK87_STRMM
MASVLQFYLGSALECYVCNNQDGNYDKCVKTVQTCDQFQDWCLSTVKWGSLPYWQKGAPKMYYIGKKCATKDMCVRAIRDRVTLCDRIWYNDWECAECCQGDRCNYFITLGSSNVQTEGYNKMDKFPLLLAIIAVILGGTAVNLINWQQKQLDVLQDTLHAQQATLSSIIEENRRLEDKVAKQSTEFQNMIELLSNSGLIINRFKKPSKFKI